MHFWSMLDRIAKNLSWDLERQDYGKRELQINLALAVVVVKTVSMGLEIETETRDVEAKTGNDGCGYLAMLRRGEYISIGERRSDCPKSLAT